MQVAGCLTLYLNFLHGIKMEITRTSVLKCAPHQMQARLITSVSVLCIHFDYYPVEGQKRNFHFYTVQENKIQSQSSNYLH